MSNAFKASQRIVKISASGTIGSKVPAISKSYICIVAEAHDRSISYVDQHKVVPTHALVKLPHSTFGHGRLITSVDFRNLISFH